jgi:hypothetical protein
MDAFTPRNVAKFVVTTTISVKANAKAREVISDYSQFEEDDLPVHLTGQVVGWYVSAKVKPLTDKMVDKTADFIVAKREQMKNRKKDTPSEEK